MTCSRVTRRSHGPDLERDRPGRGDVDRGGAATGPDGAPPVSVYAEIGPERLEVFVRDRGPGFDIDRIPPDRHGVRESIVSRMARHGGRAVVRRLEAGTEIHLDLPTVPPPSAAPPGA